MSSFTKGNVSPNPEASSPVRAYSSGPTVMGGVTTPVVLIPAFPSAIGSSAGAVTSQVAIKLRSLIGYNGAGGAGVFSLYLVPQGAAYNAAGNLFWTSTSLTTLTMATDPVAATGWNIPQGCSLQATGTALVVLTANYEVER